MIPAYYVRLEKLPLTSNGKIDKKALPDPEIKATGKYVAPSNEEEVKLVEIWSEILKIDKELVSVNRSFFELGGHSLNATILVNKIRKNLNVEVPLKEIFSKQNIENLADYIITVKQLNKMKENIEIMEVSI